MTTQQYCELTVTLQRRNLLHHDTKESGVSDRRALPRYIVGSNNPYGFSGLQDSGLVEFVSSVCSFHQKNRQAHPEHQKDMAELSFEQAARATLEGGVHAFFDEKQNCMACFFVEVLGAYKGHLLLKGGDFAVHSRREITEFMDTMLLSAYQGAWVVMRTWNGMRSLLRRLLKGKEDFGPWLEYGYDEFRYCLPDISEEYLRKRTSYVYGDSERRYKEDNGNRLIVRPPVNAILTQNMLPSQLSSEDLQKLQARMQRQLSSVEMASLVEYYARIERAGRLGRYQVPDVRNLHYGDRL